MTSEMILPDSCHCFHLGWGIDLAASGVVLLCKKQFFDGSTLDAQLSRAYEEFCGWLSRVHKKTGIDWWSIKKLNMATTLVLSCKLSMKSLRAFFLKVPQDLPHKP